MEMEIVMRAPRIRLGINIDHVATLRNARGGVLPDPIQAARLAAESGADNITAHLREDRRHISDLPPGARLAGSPIRTGEHCYGCAAGQGSSCGGALAE